MLLVIFGAGASFDSVSDRLNARPYRELGADHMPPLSINLFDDRSDYQNILNKYPAAKGIVPELRRRVGDGENIEEVLQSLYDSPITRNKKGVAATRYYLRDLIQITTESWYGRSDGMTNYDLLLNHIDDATENSEESVLIVTFNYDCLLENALKNHGVNINSIDDYIGNRKYKLIKPHGSINWKQYIQFRVIKDNWMQELIEEPESVTVLKHEKYVINSYDTVKRTDHNSISLIPVIAIPMKDKSEFLCPDDHLQLLKNSLPKVNRILTIGWRGTEKHFTDLLNEHVPRATIGVVGHNPDSCRQVKENLRATGLEGAFGYKEYSEGFSGFVHDNKLETFLQ